MKDLAVKALEGLELEVTVTTAVTRPWLGAPYQSAGSASRDSAQVSIHVDGDARSGGAPSLEGVDDEVHEAFRGTSLAIVATSTTSVVRTTQAGGQCLATAGARDHQLRTAPCCFPVATTTQAPTTVRNEGSHQFSCSLSTTLVLARHGVVPEDDETDTSTPEPVIVEELMEEELPSKADSEVTTLAAPLPLAPEKKKKYVIFLPKPRNWDGRGASEIVADEVGQVASQEDDRHLLPALTSQNVSGASTKDHSSAPTASSSADADGRFASDKHLLPLNSRRRQSIPQSGTAAPARAGSITWASEGGREQRVPAVEDLELGQPRDASQLNHSRKLTSQELVRQSRGGYNTSSTPAALTSQWRQQPQPRTAALGHSEVTVTYSQATPGNSRVQSSMHVQASHLQPIAMTITSSSTSEQLPQLAAQAAVLNSLSWSQAEGRINQLQSHAYMGISGSRTVCRQYEGRGDAHIHFPLARSVVRELLPTQHLRIDNTTQDTGKDETMNNEHVYGQGGTASDEGIGLQSARSCEEIQGPGGGPVSTRPDLCVHTQADNVLGHPTQQSPVPMPIAECLDNDGGRRRVSVSGLTVTGSGVLKIVSATTGQEANSQSPSDHAQGRDTAADTRPLLDHIEGSKAAEGQSQPPAKLDLETSHAALDMGSAVHSGTGENLSTGPASNEPRDHGYHVETATDDTSSIVDCGQECSLATGHEAGEIVLEDRDTRYGVKTIAEAVVSTEISSQFDGVLDAVLTEHFVLVAMEPQQTTTQVHGQSATIPDTPSELQGEDMLNSGSIDSIQSGAKQEGKSISDDRQVSNLVETAEVPSADLGAETNGVNSTISTSGGPASTCAIHKPDAHGPDIGCAIHKPNDIKGSPTHTSTPSPLLQTRIISSHTHCPTSTSDGDAKCTDKASEASTRQDKSELGRATEAPAPLQMVKGTMAMADLSFERPQPFENENASTSHPTHSAPAQLSEGVSSCNENEQQLHQASQPQTRGRGEPSKSQEREGCVADQQEQSSLSQATQQQEDNPEGERVCKVPGPCPFCLGHNLLTTGKAKLGRFGFLRSTSSGLAANQGQSASTQHTMAGSEGGFDKSNQASSSSFVQLAPGKVLATAEDDKDRVANLEQNLPIEDRANCQPERIHGNLHGQPPSPSPDLESTVPVLVKPFPQGVTQTPPVETTVPPITEHPQHVTSGSVEPRILHVPTNLPSEKEKMVHLCTDIPATNPDEVDTHVPTAVDSSYPKTSSIELQSSTSPNSQILASRERSQTHDGTDEKVIVEKSTAQGEPQHLITKRETENLKRIEMNPSANDQTPSPEENTTVLTNPEQNVPRSDIQASENSSSTPVQVLRDLKNQSAGKTCCYPLATEQQKPKTEGSNVAISAESDIQQHPPTSCMDQRLTSTANTQEPLTAPPPQKDSSTATTSKIEVSEASDCILQDLGEARKSAHQDSGGNLCCYPFAQKKSGSTTTDACMHDNQIGVSKSDHPLSSTTSLKEGSQRRDESDIETTIPLVAGVSSSISTLDQSETEQKKLQQPLHEPRLPTCCLAVTTAQKEHHGTDKTGTSATLKDGPKKSEKAVEGSTTPLDAKNNTTMGFPDQSEEKQKSIPQSSGGLQLSNCCLPVPTTLGKHHQSDCPGTIATPNDDPSKSEKAVEEPTMHADAKNSTSIASADQSEHMQTKLTQPLDGPRRSTCCLPVTTPIRKHHESDNQGTTTTLKDDSQKSESVVKGSATPLDAKSPTNIGSVDQSEDKQKNLLQPWDGSQLSTCCLPLSRRHDSDSPGTIAPLRDGPEMSEKAAEKSTMPTNAEKNTNTALGDQSEDKQKSSPQSMGGLQFSTCCLPVPTTLGKHHHQSDSPGTVATPNDGSTKSEKAVGEPRMPVDAKNNTSITSVEQSGHIQTKLPQPLDGPQRSTCCLPVTTTLGKHHESDNQGTTATQKDDPKKSESAAEGSTTPLDATSTTKIASIDQLEDKQKNLPQPWDGSQLSTCCFPLGQHHESNSPGTTAPLRDGPEKSEKAVEESTTPIDAEDKRKSSPQSVSGPQLSNCCLPIPTTLGKNHQSDSPRIVATSNDGSTKNEKTVKEPREPADAKNNTTTTSTDQSKHTQTKLPQPLDGPQRSTCCLPVTTTLRKHHESDNQGTIATLEDDPQKSEGVDEGSTMPLDAKSSTNIASVHQSKDKQKNLPQSPQKSTCCLPLNKRHENNSLGKTALLRDGLEKSEKTVEESATPVDARNNTNIASSDQSEDKQKSSPQSVGGPELSNSCLPIPTALGRHHQSDNLTTVAASNDGSTKNEKTVEEPRMPADAKNNTSIPSADQSEHMQTKQPQPYDGPQRSTCCLPVTTALRKNHESDNQLEGTTATLKDDPQKSESVGEGSTMPLDAKSTTNIASVHQLKDKQKNLPQSSQLSTCCLPLSKRHENDSLGTTALLRDGLEKSEKAVEESAMPVDARNNTNIASSDQSEDKQKSSPQSVGSPELSNCCLPTPTALGKHHQNDNPRTVATSDDGSTKNEKTVEELRMPADAKSNRSMASADQSEHMQTKLPQPLDGPQRSTCCLPVTTALRKHPESDNQGTTATLKDDSQKSESVAEGSTMPVDAKSTTNIASVHQSKDKQKNLPQPWDGLQLSTCCLPQSKRHESDSPGTTAPLRDGPEESEKAVEKSTMAIDARKNTSIASSDQFEDKQKDLLLSLNGPQQSSGTCCLPVKTALRKSHESDNHGTFAMSKDGSKKSEKASEGSLAPRDATNTTNIPSTDQSKDKQTRLPQPTESQRWSTCCLPVTTSLSKHHQGDNPVTSATVGKELFPKDNEELGTESAHNTICYPAAQIKERGLLSGPNTHEPLVDASSLEIESNHITTTTDKRTIQKKTVESDANDTVHPFQGEEKGMKHQDSGGNVCCYPFVGRESKSAVEDNYAHNNQTGVSQSDHQSPRTTAINNHSKDSIEGENSHRRTFLVPKLSTCCFPSTVAEVPPREVLETPAKLATEPSLQENEVMIARSSVTTAEVVDEDGTKRTVTSQVFLVAVDDPNSGAQSVKNIPEVQSANDKPELQTFTFHGDNDNIITGTETKKNDAELQTVVADSNSKLASAETQSQQTSVEDSKNKQVTRRVTSITSCCIPEKSEICQRICKHFKKLKSKLLTCTPKAGEAAPAGLQPFPVAQEQTVPFLEDKKEESQSLIEQEAAARAAALRQQEQIESIERVKEATLCRKRLLERQKEDSRLHLDNDPYLQSRLCSERTKRRHKAQAAQAKREREGHMLQAREGFVTTKGWEESQRMPTNFFDALSAAARLRRRQIFLESEQGVHAFAGLAQARDNLAATKRRNRMRAATDLSVANMEATMMAKRQQKRHLQEAIWWDANTRRHRIAWEARHAGLRIMDRDLKMATKKEEERQLLLLDTLEILDAKTERESHPLETWYDNYKCGPEMVEGDGQEFTIDYLADTSDKEEEGQKIGTTEQVAKLNHETVQLMPMTVPS